MKKIIYNNKIAIVWTAVCRRLGHRLAAVVWGVSGIKPVVAVAIAALLCLGCTLPAPKTDSVTETYRYEVVYQWGIIWKKAAEATLTLAESNSNQDTRYRAELVAQTAPFADKIFRVRDTLVAHLTEEYAPLYYAKITNEDNVYRRDELVYKYEKGKVIGETTLHRPHRNAIDYATLEATEAPAVDMLSLFFYLRNIDFSKAKMHQNYELQVFSGKRVELLRIQYMGRTLYTRPDKKQQGAYRLDLRFSIAKGGKETDKISVLISDDGRCIPLFVEGKLPIGSLKARYIGS